MLKGNLLDRAIGYLSPSWGADRIAHRARGGIIASYQGAVSNRLSTPWTPSAQPASIWGLPVWEQSQMRDRSRKLERDNPIADGMLSRAVENVVATGFEHQATTDDPDWNKNADALFDDWTESADITGLTWLEHQRLVFRSHLRDGDVGSILIGGNDPSYAKLQPVEGDLIAPPIGMPPQQLSVPLTVITDGVRIDDTGRPIEFFVNTYDRNGKRTSRNIAAQDFIFFPRLKRLSQVRGEPCFTQLFTLFDQIDGWIEATIVAARMAACFGVIIKRTDSNKWLKNLPTDANAEGKQQRQITFEPGMAQYLNPGEEVETLNPSQPQHHFPDTMVAMMRLLGLTLGMPLELVLMDFSRTNFSSARASLLQAYRSFKSMQALFVDRYLKRVYRWRISKFIKEGKLAPRADAWNHKWIAQPWPFLDPVKEALAIQLGIDMGLGTLGTALTAQGHEFGAWVVQRKAELDAMRLANIPIVHSSAIMPYDDPSKKKAKPQPVMPAGEV